ncbi:MAG: putative biopolymer transport protein [Betaproteobacteria bacterium]|nr:putative biopolymer transport protein [Betaproteobacteria bacterium]
MAEINMIPLIDVMLVLLVIFIITAPLLTHAVKIELPKASSRPNITKPQNIQLGIRAGGDVYWNGETVDKATLSARMEAAATLDPQPDVHLRADGAAEYRLVAEVLAAAARAGLVKIGFVTEPATVK